MSILTPATSTKSSRRNLSEHLPDPKEFDGSRTDFKRFKSQVYNKLIANLNRFPTNQQRMLYILSRLTRTAYGQILPYVKRGIVNLKDYDA